MTPADEKQRQDEYTRRRLKERFCGDPRSGVGENNAPKSLKGKRLTNIFGGAMKLRGYHVLPFAALFCVGTITKVVYDAVHQSAHPVCIDCVRQREIAEEIYGTKPRVVHVKARQMP
jgi:hypothetical protein